MDDTKLKFEQLAALIKHSNIQQLTIQRQIDTQGYTGTSILTLLIEISNLFCFSKDFSISIKNYLEIGVFRGKTLLNVSNALPGLRAYGIDNFSQFNEGGDNKAWVLSLIERNRLNNVTVLDCDFEDVEAVSSSIPLGSVGVFFVDGPHDYRSQLLQLLLYKRFLSDESVIIVDDCNYEHVRRANHDFLIAEPEFKLVLEAYTGVHPNNAKGVETHQRWWNGVNVLVRDKSGLFPKRLPPISNNSNLYLNTHILFSSKYAVSLPDIERLMDTPESYLIKMRQNIRERNHRSDFRTLNMWDLPDCPHFQTSDFIK